MIPVGVNIMIDIDMTDEFQYMTDKLGQIQIMRKLQMLQASDLEMLFTPYLILMILTIFMPLHGERGFLR